MKKTISRGHPNETEAVHTIAAHDRESAGSNRRYCKRLKPRPHMPPGPCNREHEIGIATARHPLILQRELHTPARTAAERTAAAGQRGTREPLLRIAP